MCLVLWVNTLQDLVTVKLVLVDLLPWVLVLRSVWSVDAVVNLMETVLVFFAVLVNSLLMDEAFVLLALLVPFPQKELALVSLVPRERLLSPILLLARNVLLVPIPMVTVFVKIALLVPTTITLEPPSVSPVPVVMSRWGQLAFLVGLVLLLLMVAVSV